MLLAQPVELLCVANEPKIKKVLKNESMKHLYLGSSCPLMFLPCRALMQHSELTCSVLLWLEQAAA